MTAITREQMIEAYQGWKDTAGPNDNVMFFHHQSFVSKGCLSCMNTQEMDAQKKIWKTLKQQGKIEIHKYNSKTYTHEDGNTWHFLVVQPTNLEDSNIDPLGIFILGEMVSGFIYAFKNKKHRDRTQDYVMK